MILRRIMPLALVAFAGCGARPPAAQPGSNGASAMLPDVRVAKDRPPVVLVSREGDPSGAIALAVTTSAMGSGTSDDEGAEPAVALAALVERRLAAQGLVPVVVPSWSGVRAAVLVAGAAEAPAATEAIRDALTAPADDKDLAAAKKKLAALGARPLRDAALVRWARCVGSPHAEPRRAGKSGEDLSVARLEKWRAAAHGLGRVAIAVAGPLAMGEAVAAAIARGSAWSAGAPPSAPPPPANAGIDAEVYDASGDGSTQALVHATLDVGTGSHAVTTAEALGDPDGPLAMRLAGLEVPFRLREVTAAADPRGGCVGVVLAADTSKDRDGGRPTSDLAARVADAVALVHVEAQVHLTEGGVELDGRTLARRAGDSREAAERAAWWTLADTWMREADKRVPTLRGSIALGMPARRSGGSEPSRDALGSAVSRALASWRKPVAEGRTRVEPGQGETWILLASPCGTEGETDADAGLTALATVAAAEAAKRTPFIRTSAQTAATPRVEPWLVPDGAGLLVHGPALHGETPAAHARRLADIAGRSFSSEPLTSGNLSLARSELLQRGGRDGAGALAVLASAIAPGHATWFDATGREDAIARSADAAIVARSQALRAGPLRVAVIANVDASQGEAAVRAVDRWIDRRTTGEARACRAGTAGASPRPGTYAIEPRPGASPEAWLAFPFTPADDAARAAAALVAAALDGDGGLLEKALGGGLARAWSARVIGVPRAPALVVRVVSTQDALDDTVMQVRALVDRLKKGGLPASDHERASAVAARDAVAVALDPRARVVATWRGDAVPEPSRPSPRSRPSADEVRSFASRFLSEDAMVVVAARPGRTKTP